GHRDGHILPYTTLFRSPYFMALQQEDAKSPYTTWGWAQQAVGVDMPMVPDAAVGSEQVTPDSEGLVMTPAKALELYASVLSLGEDRKSTRLNSSHVSIS